MNKIDPVLKLHELKQFGEFGGVNPSITDSATYTFMEAQTMTDTFEGKAEGCFLYSRHWNPSNKYLSDALAAMEGTEAGWVPLPEWVQLLVLYCMRSVPAII